MESNFGALEILIQQREARVYQFDFTSNGEDRYQGTITLAGRQVLQIKLPPHRID